MPRTVVIRNIPDDVYSTLRARAKAACMTLTEYLLAEITRIAERSTVAEVLERAAATRGGSKLEDIVKAVREGRDGRA